MKQSRRRFVKLAATGTIAGAAGVVYWVGTSRRRSARLLRTIVQDSKRAILPAPFRPDPGLWSDNDITICWIGHATTLINFHGFRILTDPAFGRRIGVSLGIGTVGPKRYIAPALRIDELPSIDLILLSHAHMDHMDIPTLHKLERRTPTITAKDTSDIVAVAGLRTVTELGWNERTRVIGSAGDLEVEAIEVKHWGKRWPSERERGYNGYILRREGKALIFAGDTARTDLFRELRSRGPFEAAIMPIGAYDPWIRNHCTPEEAVELANGAGAKHIVPVHHQVFRLSNEPMDEPINRFAAALESEPERVALRDVGETFVCPRT